MGLSQKRIIMIHGLASKPPEADVHELWSKCLIENIRINDKTLAKQLDNDPDVFVSAYWANATPHHIEDDAAYFGYRGIYLIQGSVATFLEKLIEETERYKKATQNIVAEVVREIKDELESSYQG